MVFENPLLLGALGAGLAVGIEQVLLEPVVLE